MRETFDAVSECREDAEIALVDLAGDHTACNVIRTLIDEVEKLFSGVNGLRLEDFEG